MDFTVSSNPAVSTITRAITSPYQVNDWTGQGFWKSQANVTYIVASAARTGATMTLSGVVNKTGPSQAISGYGVSPGADLSYAVALSASGDYTVVHTNIATVNYAFDIDVELSKKPSFHN